MKALHLVYLIIRKVTHELVSGVDTIRLWFVLDLNQVDHEPGLKSNGVPVISVHDTGRFWIGKDVRMNNGWRFNRIGRQQRCQFIVGEHAELMIGNNVGISSSTIVCLERIHIGAHVKIGGNVVIYDTDFHSLDPMERMNDRTDAERRKCSPVTIGHHAFIGAHSTILKGVHIGNNAIIGAGSVVACNVPANELWAGNPARFIRRLDQGDLKRVA
jgi:acetyltransferase-like isoleucine patch superfamily enzyme